MSAQSGSTRLSWPRLVLVLALAVAITWTGVHAVAAAVTHVTPPGSTAFSGYVDVTATPSYPFETPAGPAQSHALLSFVVSSAASACTPSWGGAYTLESADSSLELPRRIAQLRLTGGDIGVSFGGQAGSELAVGCTSTPELTKAYQSVVDRYSLTSIDLDLEGAALSDTVAQQRRAAAVAAVQKQAHAAGRELSVWVTLPVSTDGLSDEGRASVSSLLAAGVDLSGVNGLTMDLGTTTSASSPESTSVLAAASALHGQVVDLFAGADQRLDDGQAWAKVGLTPMIGQNDNRGEVFTLDDATTVNSFARAHGVGRLSLWSLNRDSTCTSPLPTVLSVVQTSCSGIDQHGESFAIVLAANGGEPASSASASASASASSPTAVPSASSTGAATGSASSAADDPAHSPFPIWDPYGTYDAGTKTVWHHQVFQAKYWTSGVAPDAPSATPGGSPWMLLGPVQPGDTPAPLPTLPAGTYPQWDATHAYVAGTRVQVGLVPYVAKWWSQGQRPGESVPGGSPWLLVQ
jgi:chitinase